MNRREGGPRRFRSTREPDLWKELDRIEAQRNFERNPLPVPEVGDEIYIPDPPLTILRKVRTGGRATVTRTLFGSMGFSEATDLIRVAQDPGSYYQWYGRRGIGWQQGLLKEQFGDGWAGKRE